MPTSRDGLGGGPGPSSPSPSRWVRWSLAAGRPPTGADRSCHAPAERDPDRHRRPDRTTAFPSAVPPRCRGSSRRSSIRPTVAVVPAGVPEHAAVLPVAGHDPDRRIRTPHRRRGQRRRCRLRRVRHARDLARRCGLRDRLDRQVPERVSVGSRSVRPARAGTGGSPSATPTRGRRTRAMTVIDQGVPLFVGDYPGGLRDGSTRTVRGRLRASPAERPAVLPLLRAERARTPRGSLPARSRQVRRRPRSNGTAARDQLGPRRAPVGARPAGRSTIGSRCSFVAGGAAKPRRCSRSTTRSGGSSTTVRARGELDRTVIIFMTDNGWSFGEHRWVGKRCPYDPCIRTPLAIRSPWVEASTVDQLVSERRPRAHDRRARGRRRPPMHDGLNLAPLIIGDTTRDDPARRHPDRVGGRRRGPALAGRPHARTSPTSRRRVDGSSCTTSAGALGPSDPWQLHNRADDPRYAGVRGRTGRAARRSPRCRAAARVDSCVVERRPGPIIRPASPRRPTRQQVARRRAFVAVVVVVALFLVWQFWPAGRQEHRRDGPVEAGQGERRGPREAATGTSA